MTPARIRAIAISEGCVVPESDDEHLDYREPFGRVCMARTVEDEFGIDDISDAEMEQCLSVNDWAELVGRRMG